MATSIVSRFLNPSVRNLMKTASNRTDICQFNVRRYARGSWRSVQDVITADEDENRWRGDLKAKNPRKNPYVTFEKQDPVHRSMSSEKWNRSGNAEIKTSPGPSRKGLSKMPGHEIDRKKTSSVSKSDKSMTSYEKLDDGDIRFGQAILSAKSRKEREKKNIILLEGFRLIQDAIDSGAVAKCIYFSDKDFLDKLQLVDDVPRYKVQYRHLKIWSDTQTPSGIMAIFEMPKRGECPSPQESSFPLTLICDNVRDPGNMGTLIRTAAAVGCQRILTTKGCVDVWEPKVLRSGMGSHFHIPILPSIPWELILNYMDDTTQVFIAETGKQNSHRARHKPLSSDDIIELSSDSFDISALNDKNQQFKENYSDFISSDSLYLHVDNAYLDREHVKQFARLPLQCVSYDKLTWSGGHVAVVIGGETTGVSPAAKKFAFDRYGQCLTIPMSPVVNSLNSAIAASVILYEIRKHLDT